jgi:F0F1-type ATP synthase epsilon subunit
MARTFELSVLTPAEPLLEVSAAEWVHLRLMDDTGITIYPGHAPLLAETMSGPLRYADNMGEHAFNAGAGILQVKVDRVTVFTGSEWEAEEMVPATIGPLCPLSEERQFERLARELRSKLKEEPESALGSVLDVDHG